MRLAASRAACTAGSSNPTKIPIMAITTSSSTSVNAVRWGRCMKLLLLNECFNSQSHDGQLATIAPHERPGNECRVGEESSYRTAAATLALNADAQLATKSSCLAKFSPPITWLSRRHARELAQTCPSLVDSESPYFMIGMTKSTWYGTVMLTYALSRLYHSSRFESGVDYNVPRSE
jgi:hypothetical protein